MSAASYLSLYICHGHSNVGNISESLISVVVGRLFPKRPIFFLQRRIGRNYLRRSVYSYIGLRRYLPRKWQLSPPLSIFYLASAVRLLITVNTRDPWAFKWGNISLFYKARLIPCNKLVYIKLFEQGSLLHYWYNARNFLKLKTYFSTEAF